MRAALPTSSRCPSRSQETPAPASARNAEPVFSGIPRASASRTIAAASGCSEWRSAPPARARSSSSVTSDPAAGRTAATSGRPSVTVPVLSNTTVSTRAAVSSALPFRIRIPSRAPRPIPAIRAIGVASPSAQGQATTRTDKENSSASANAAFPIPNQRRNVRIEMAITPQTKYPETRSASAATGGRDPCASRIIPIIRARAVSPPICSARIRRVPSQLTEPPVTRDPAVFSTGSGSPVSMDSSTEEAPSVTVPSTGIRSPGRTRRRSPLRTSATGISVSEPDRTTHAVSGASFISSRIAPDAFRRERDSRNFPSIISATIMPAVSKYRCPNSPRTIRKRLYTTAPPVQSAISESMFGARRRSVRNPEL